MSVISLTKWGNSVGVRIPTGELKAANAYVGEKFELSVNAQGGFTMIPLKNPQEGWLEAFNAMADAGEDKMLIEDLPNEFDKDEWTW